MTPSTTNMKQGTCGCGRSPTGDCIGWHALPKELYEEKLAQYNKHQEQLKENQKNA